jgi:hypothetical protein
MANYGKQRATMLREIFNISDGDLAKEISLVDLRRSLNLPSIKDAEIIARQLAAKGLIDFPDTDSTSDGTVFMNMRGIEESERLETPSYKRFASDHPIMWPLIAAIFVMLAGKLVEIWFRQ